MDSLSRERAAALDAADPLAGFRERFVFGEDERIYLDGNSLGRLPVATRDRLAVLVREWGERLVEGWADWIETPARVGDLLAEAVLGAGQGEVVVADSTTVNLYKLCAALLDGRPGALVTDAGNFPTDRYVLEGLAAATGRELRLVGAPEDVAAERDVALVVLSHVDYRSGALADMAALSAEIAADVVWDVSHSVGVVPIELRASGVQFAVGCTYKYLNAGPGAPAFLYVAHERQAALRSPIWGWFGQREQFSMERSYDPEDGIRRFLAGTPPILGLAAVQEGVALTAEAGVDAIRAKSVAQTELIIALADDRLRALGVAVGSPRDAAARGSHVALRHPEAWPICRALIERSGVVPDFRGPDIIRLGVAPLYTRFTDVWDALDRLRGIVERGEQRLVNATPGRVT